MFKNFFEKKKCFSYYPVKGVFDTNFMAEH